MDGTIQRFEFTFELAWKLAQSMLAYDGIQAASPRGAIKEAFQQGLIQEGKGWIKMLEDRNRTSHIYDEKLALRIYKNIKADHLRLLKDWADVAARRQGPPA